MSVRTLKLISYFLAALFLLIGLYCALWLLSSSSLASLDCAGQWSLSHPNFRCRQPNLALLGMLISSTLAALAILLGLKAGKRARPK